MPELEPVIFLLVGVVIVNGTALGLVLSFVRRYGIRRWPAPRCPW